MEGCWGPHEFQKRSRMAVCNVEKLQKSFFVYLLVRPFCDDATCDMCVDTVLGGVGLSAKIRAKNESLRQSPRLMLCGDGAPLERPWRLLVGFYAHKSTWLRRIKNHWRLKNSTWEEALLQGVKFAFQFSVNKVLYVSAEARSEPPSPLLSELQSMYTQQQQQQLQFQVQHDQKSESRDSALRKKKCQLMQIVMCNKTSKEKLVEIMRSASADD